MDKKHEEQLDALIRKDELIESILAWEPTRHRGILSELPIETLSEAQHDQVEQDIRPEFPR